ncbi:MAG: multicomponent Na+:H+ antiporter subunit D [Rickettsiales bacterium]|jgi:multicomponent Na+:H+ antiporter subunit D
MISYIAPYLLLFLPLIASVLCFLINFKKADFWIIIGVLSALLFLLLKLILNFSNNRIAFANDVGLGILSIPTEYYLDFLSLFFLSLAILIILLITFFYDSDIRKILENDNRQLFYATILLNMFGLIGIFATNNIFNLFIYIEIYCLTLAGIMTISNDVAISKIAFRYFCKIAPASILLLLSLVILYVSSGNFKISEISNLPDFDNSNLIFWSIATAVMFKFFALRIYFKFLISKDLIANFLIALTFIISVLVGFYLLIRVSLFLLHPSDAFFFLLAFTGFCLVFYGNYKLFKTHHLKVFAAYFSLINLGFVLIAIGFFNDQALLPAIMYIANYAFLGVAIFITARIMHKKFSSSHFKHLANLINCKLTKKTAIEKLVTLFILLTLINLPILLMFWPSWNLAILAFGFDIGFVVIFPIILTNLVMISLSVRFLSSRNI